MRFQKIPYYLRKSIDEIVHDARENITIHYLKNQEYGRSNISKVSTFCQITDHNDYSQYFFEPIKFEIPEAKIIKCMDQRSAHQNGIIALKKWEKSVKEFLEKPLKRHEIIEAEPDVFNIIQASPEKIREKIFQHPTPENNYEMLRNKRRVVKKGTT